MQRWATLSSSVYSPCMNESGNLVVCTGSGHVVEFVNDNKGLPQANVLLELDGQPNCVAFDSSEEMTVCDIASQSLALATIRQDKETSISTLCSEYENKPFNGPSCCIIDKLGRKFFTDSGPIGDTGLDSPNGSVFCINRQGILRPLSHKKLAQPTGLAMTENGRCIYVTEMFRNRILRFVETGNNNGVFMQSVFYQFSGAVGPTGIDIDSEGNLYVTRFEHKGLESTGFITVIDQSGKLIVDLASKAPEVTGVAYDKKTNNVYVTELSTSSVYRLHVDDLFAKSKKINFASMGLMQQ